MKYLLVLCLGLVSVLNTGCSSVLSRGFGGEGLYLGVYSDTMLVGAQFTEEQKSEPLIMKSALVCFAIIDFPFSLVADTIWIPFDINAMIERKKKEEQMEKKKADKEKKAAVTQTQENQENSTAK